MAIRVFIDQGHNPTGNHNTGAIGNGLFEENINYEVGTFLADILRSDPRFEVRVSRENPDTVLGTTNATSLRERVEKANSWPADYFISIHSNASDNPDFNGTEVYVYKKDTRSYYLAEDVLASIVSRVGTRDNEVRLNPALYVLRKTNMPAILVELGYITNFEDAQKLRDEPYEFAYAIYDGLLNYLDLEPIELN